MSDNNFNELNQDKIFKIFNVIKFAGMTTFLVSVLLIIFLLVTKRVFLIMIFKLLISSKRFLAEVGISIILVLLCFIAKFLWKKYSKYLKQN